MIDIGKPNDHTLIISKRGAAYLAEEALGSGIGLGFLAIVFVMASAILGRSFTYPVRTIVVVGGAALLFTLGFGLLIGLAKTIVGEKIELNHQNNSVSKNGRHLADLADIFEIKVERHFASGRYLGKLPKHSLLLVLRGGARIELINGLSRKE